MVKQVKICGLTRASDACAAVDAGADYLGFIHFAKSPRHLSFERAADLEPALPKGVPRVGVTVDADNMTLICFKQALQLTHIQAHGSETVERLEDIRVITGAKIIKVIKVATPSDVAAAKAFDGHVDLLLFDTKPLPQDTLPGGNARTFPWDLLKGHVFESPTLIAGGLTPDNAGEALLQSGADGVDVSSGIESAPAKKSHDLIKAFVRAAKTVS